MHARKVGLGANTQFGLKIEEQIKLFKRTGFEAFFTAWDNKIKKYKEISDNLNMLYQSVHAPTLRSADMWKNDQSAQDAVDELISCVRDCGEAEIPIVVVHPYSGFDEEYIPNQYGVENFCKVVEEAGKWNIKIAFENLEGEEYLNCLMDAFSDYENVGFCWDSGHELCYNKGKDMLKLYGNRLIATHLNDNLGVSDRDGNIFYTDDLHLLPFDGINNWENIAKRLNKCNFNDTLTFELKIVSQPGRHENDKYASMPIEEYIAECYARARRVENMVRNNLGD